MVPLPSHALNSSGDLQPEASGVRVWGEGLSRRVAGLFGGRYVGYLS